MSTAPRPFVSVIIPAYVRERDGLARCLAALEAQTYPPELYEVVVVDNGSALPLDDVVGGCRRARLVVERTPGSYAARNAGVRHARGDVLAFTDADCIPAHDWLERGAARVHGAPQTIVAGRIDLFFRKPGSPSSVELYESVTALQQRHFVENGRFGATANLLVARETFERVGPFVESTRSGGDVEWCQRAAASGFELEYADECRVAHPARATLAELYAKVVRTMGGAHVLRRRARFLGLDRGWLAGLLPPVRQALASWRDTRLNNWRDRVRVVAVMVFVRYVETWERLRLTLGGEPRR